MKNKTSVPKPRLKNPILIARESGETIAELLFEFTNSPIRKTVLELDSWCNEVRDFLPSSYKLEAYKFFLDKCVELNINCEIYNRVFDNLRESRRKKGEVF